MLFNDTYLYILPQCSDNVNLTIGNSDEHLDNAAQAIRPLKIRDAPVKWLS